MHREALAPHAVAADYRTLLRDGLVLFDHDSGRYDLTTWASDLADLGRQDGLPIECWCPWSGRADDIYIPVAQIVHGPGDPYSSKGVDPEQGALAAVLRPQIEADWGVQLATARRRAGLDEGIR